MRDLKDRGTVSAHKDPGLGGARVFFGLSLAGSLLLLGWSVWGERGWLDLRKVRQQESRLREQIRDLEKENRRLLREVTALREDPYAVERIAREELGLVKPGEVVYELKSGTRSPY